MKPILFELEADLPLFEPLMFALNAETGALEQRRFPDGETYLRIATEVAARPCVILANLAEPDPAFLPLAFLAGTLKELGATTVGLVAPYLSYMRQDYRFRAGEAVTSRLFARLLSEQVDWLVTVDPHLHRYHNLEQIYSIPATSVQGAPALARWLAQDSKPLLLVGPDSESEQWVEAIARSIKQPFVVGFKERRGDRDVNVVLPDLSAYRGRRAVIVDDVISSGQTILKCLSALKAEGFEQVDCVAVHGVFADGIDKTLRDSGIRTLSTSNSIPHNSNAVDLSELLVEPIRKHLGA